MSLIMHVLIMPKGGRIKDLNLDAMYVMSRGKDRGVLLLID